MQSKQLFAIIAAVALTAGTAALAQDSPRPSPEPVSYEAIRNLTPPVTAGDVTGRPYRVVGEVRAEVRKATVFSRSPTQSHVFRELWERAERLGADAVINANYGDELGLAPRHRPGDQVPHRRGDRGPGAARADA